VPVSESRNQKAEKRKQELEVGGWDWELRVWGPGTGQG